MRLNNTDFPRKAQHPLLMGLASLPIAMMLTLTAAPAFFPWCWCFPAALYFGSPPAPLPLTLLSVAETA